MAKYSYTIINKQGLKENGQIEAISREDAASQIKKSDWYIVSLERKKGSKFLPSFLTKEEKFSSFELINFTNHLASMFKSGTPLVEALEIYIDDEKKKGTAIVEALINNVEQGKKLSEAMASYPKIFSSLYIALIQSGELTGKLDETTEYLANELRRDYEFKERIKSALLYPAIVLAAALLVMVFLVLVVIPKITQVTRSLGGDLPFATRIVSSAASFLTNFGPLILLLILGMVIGFFVLLKNKKTRAKLDPYLLRLPLVGNLIKKYSLSRFLRIIGSCLKCGIPLSPSFKIMEDVLSNVRYQEACERIEEKIVKGSSLSKVLSQEETALFPNVIVRSIKGAEKMGFLDEAMLRLSQFYEEGIDRDLKRIISLIEPALVIVLGIIVAAIAISVIAPIYQMTARIK